MSADVFAQDCFFYSANCRNIRNSSPMKEGMTDIAKLLDAFGIRSSYQRLALGRIIFGRGDRHLTAEMLYEEALKEKIRVSLATVYNTLNRFANDGALQKVAIDGSKTYFDTNIASHQHFYVENTHELLDIPGWNNLSADVLEIPEGYEIVRVETLVRIRRKSGSGNRDAA